MNFILFDDEVVRGNLLPLTFTRPIADIRIGILTIREKWEHLLGTKTSSETIDYLKKKFPIAYQKGKNNVWINSSILPTETLVEEIKKLKSYQILTHKNTVIAINTGEDKALPTSPKNAIDIESREKKFLEINFLYDIFSKNGEAIEADFKLLTKNKKSQSISKSNKIIGEKNIFLEKGAVVECAVLNASAGPIYIGKDAEIMEGSLVRGPFALCEHSTLKMGTKIYGATTIGPHSKVGGELNNSVVFGYSNKAHDGFLGNSVIGEWCNLGADTNNSNLKNNYSEVKLWNYPAKYFKNTGLTFCGLIMGDHSKCGINTMFNTGTVVGVSANIFGSGFPPKFIPSFSWGGANGFTDYKLNTACEVAEKVMQRRGIKFNSIEKNIFSEVFKIEKKYRK
ncbi:MAG TPA: GlmU family protein [Bacteroidia bacterium]|nr:GlmU family protein [Bacteroidia bacterium]